MACSSISRVVDRGERAERQLAAAAERRHDAPFRLERRTTPRRRAPACSARRHGSSSASDFDRDDALARRRNALARRNHRRDAIAEAEPVQAGGGEHQRVVFSRIELAQPRVDVAADRREARPREEPTTAARCAGRCSCRCSPGGPATASAARDVALAPPAAARRRRADPPAAAWPRSSTRRAAPPACPWRCGPPHRSSSSSSASSISLTNSRLPPTSESGADCSRSPVVLMMTSSTSTPADSSRAATVRACHSASWLPRVPMRSGECISRGGSAIRAVFAAPRRTAPRRRARTGGSGRPSRRDQGLVADRLQLLGRRQQQLLDEELRDLVDAGARLGRQAGQLRLEPRQLRLADRLEPLAQRDDGRDDFARLQPRAELRDLFPDDRFGPLQLARCGASGSLSRCPAGRRCCRGRPVRGRRRSARRRAARRCR